MGKKYLDTKKDSLEQSVLGVWKTAVEEGSARMDGRTTQYREHRKKLESARARRSSTKTESYEIGTDEYRKHMERITPGENIEEKKGDKEAYQKFFNSALKKFGVKSPAELEGDKKKKEVPVRIAQEVQKKYNSLRRPADKEGFQSKIAKSYKSMLDALKENSIKEKTSQDRIVGLVGDKLKEKKHG